jgi:hypothetical protein
LRGLYVRAVLCVFEWAVVVLRVLSSGYGWSWPLIYMYMISDGFTR